MPSPDVIRLIVQLAAQLMQLIGEIAGGKHADPAARLVTVWESGRADIAKAEADARARDKFKE